MADAPIAPLSRASIPVGRGKSGAPGATGAIADAAAAMPRRPAAAARSMLPTGGAAIPRMSTARREGRAPRLAAKAMGIGCVRGGEGAHAAKGNGWTQSHVAQGGLGPCVCSQGPPSLRLRLLLV